MAHLHTPLVAFFDIDGTLIDSDPESYAKAQAPGATVEEQERVFLPTPAVREAVKEFVDAGNFAFLCSGRPPSGLALLMERVPFSGYVALAGALGEMEEKELFCHSVDAALMARVIEIFNECSVAALLEGTRGSMVFMPAGEHPAIDLSVPVTRSVEKTLAAIEDLSLVKAFWMAEENGRLAPRRAELAERFRISDLGGGRFRAHGARDLQGERHGRRPGSPGHPRHGLRLRRLRERRHHARGRRRGRGHGERRGVRERAGRRHCPAGLCRRSRHDAA